MNTIINKCFVTKREYNDKCNNKMKYNGRKYSDSVSDNVQAGPTEIQGQEFA